MGRVQIERNKLPISRFDLLDALRSLKTKGAIEKYVVNQYVVIIEGDLTALELAVSHLDDDAVRNEVASEPLSGFHTEYGYGEDSEGNTRRGGTPAARYFTPDSTAEYFRQAEHFLTRHRFKSPLQRNIWKLHVEGHSILAISRKVERSYRAVYRQLQKLKVLAGLKKE